MSEATPLPPGSVIGMLGGGQLGRMTALAAARLGYRTHVFCPEADSPTEQVTPLATRAAYDDTAALDAFARQVDVATYEFENIPLATAERVAASAPLYPSPQALRICQNRLREKSFCNEAGIATARWAEVDGPESLAEALAALGAPAVLKSAELGYDGKGQVALSADSDPREAWSAMTGGAGTTQGAPAILEAFVDFALEVSVIVARGRDGDCRAYPTVENRHRNHILDQTIVPAPVLGRGGRARHEHRHHPGRAARADRPAGGRDVRYRRRPGAGQ